jgi:threonine/homoserine efflux transporter RhtA
MRSQQTQIASVTRNDTHVLYTYSLNKLQMQRYLSIRQKSLSLTLIHYFSSCLHVTLLEFRRRRTLFVWLMTDDSLRVMR